MNTKNCILLILLAAQCSLTILESQATLILLNENGKIEVNETNFSRPLILQRFSNETINNKFKTLIDVYVLLYKKNKTSKKYIIPAVKNVHDWISLFLKQSSYTAPELRLSLNTTRLTLEDGVSIKKFSSKSLDLIKKQICKDTNNMFEDINCKNYVPQEKRVFIIIKIIEALTDILSNIFKEAKSSSNQEQIKK